MTNETDTLIAALQQILKDHNAKVVMRFKDGVSYYTVDVGEDSIDANIVIKALSSETVIIERDKKTNNT